MKILLLTILFITSYTITHSNRWAVVGIDNNYAYFYDSVSVKKVSKQHFKVWVKSLPFPDVLERIRLSMLTLYNSFPPKKGDKYNSKGYDTYAYTINLIEVDCKGERIRYLSKIDYDETGGVLQSIKNKVSEDSWENVSPGSNSESILKKVCKKN